MSESIYRYEADFPILALNWSCRSDETFRLAFSSIFPAPNAFVHILQFDPYQKIRPTSIQSFSHPTCTPNTLAFLPDPGCPNPDLLASAADTLRIWQLDRDGNSVVLRGQLGDPATTYLRMLDWNRMVDRRIATLSSDSTCTVWNIAAQTVEAQPFTDPPVHAAVNDFAWGAPDVLAATFTDNKVRCVDVRAGRRAHTTHIVADGCAGLVEWNYRDPNYLAVTVGSSRVVVLDARRPEKVAEMLLHDGPVYTMAWDPHSRSRICTAGEDARALVWEIPASGQSRQTQVVAEFAAGAAVAQVKWSSLHPELVAFGCGNRLQVERVE